MSNAPTLTVPNSHGMAILGVTGPDTNVMGKVFVDPVIVSVTNWPQHVPSFVMNKTYFLYVAQDDSPIVFAIERELYEMLAPDADIQYVGTVEDTILRLQDAGDAAHLGELNMIHGSELKSLLEGDHFELIFDDPVLVLTNKYPTRIDAPVMFLSSVWSSDDPSLHWVAMDKADAIQLKLTKGDIIEYCSSPDDVLELLYAIERKHAIHDTAIYAHLADAVMENV